MITDENLLEDIASGKGLQPIQEESAPAIEKNFLGGSQTSGIRFDRFAKQETSENDNQKGE